VGVLGGDFCGDSVQITLSFGGQPSETIITKFQDSHLLKGLEDFAGDGLGRPAEVGGIGAPPISSTVHLGERLTPALPCNERWQRT